MLFPRDAPNPKVLLSSAQIQDVLSHSLNLQNKYTIDIEFSRKTVHFLVIFLLTLFVYTLKYTIVGQQANTNRQ